MGTGEGSRFSPRDLQPGRIHFLRREFGEALGWFEKLSQPPSLLVAASLVAQGAPPEETLEILQRRHVQRDLSLALAYTYAAAGDEEKALTLLETLNAGDSFLMLYCGAGAVYAALGKTDTALALLEEAGAQGRLGTFTLGKCDLEMSCLYDPIRAEPRFTQLVESLESGR